MRLIDIQVPGLPTLGQLTSLGLLLPSALPQLVLLHLLPALPHHTVSKHLLLIQQLRAAQLHIAFLKQLRIEQWCIGCLEQLRLVYVQRHERHEPRGSCDSGCVVQPHSRPHADPPLQQHPHHILFVVLVEVLCCGRCDVKSFS